MDFRNIQEMESVGPKLHIKYGRGGYILAWVTYKNWFEGVANNQVGC